MVYEKPEVAIAANSLKAIQSQGVKVSINPDAPGKTPIDTVATAGAYEADE